jgi:hypothetical protein
MILDANQIIKESELKRTSPRIRGGSEDDGVMISPISSTVNFRQSDHTPKGTGSIVVGTAEQHATY